MLIAGQVNLPDSVGEVLIFVLFLGALAGMWIVLRRTRIKAEESRRERLRGEQERRNRPEPEDPSS